MYHSRKSRRKYRSFTKPANCSFCDDPDLGKKAVLETAHAFVIPNRVFYDVWELRHVKDHLLIIPKKHVGTLSELSNAAKLDIMNIVGHYEQTDYNVYARAVNNKQRSVPHQHTHLIKSERRTFKRLIYIQKPYLLIRF